MQRIGTGIDAARYQTPRPLDANCCHQAAKPQASGVRPTRTGQLARPGNPNRGCSNVKAEYLDHIAAYCCTQRISAQRSTWLALNSHRGKVLGREGSQEQRRVITAQRPFLHDTFQLEDAMWCMYVGNSVKFGDDGCTRQSACHWCDDHHHLRLAQYGRLPAWLALLLQPIARKTSSWLVKDQCAQFLRGLGEVSVLRSTSPSCLHQGWRVIVTCVCVSDRDPAGSALNLKLNSGYRKAWLPQHTDPWNYRAPARRHR